MLYMGSEPLARFIMDKDLKENPTELPYGMGLSQVATLFLGGFTLSYQTSSPEIESLSVFSTDQHQFVSE